MFCFVFPCNMHVYTVSGMLSILFLDSQLKWEFQGKHHCPLLDCFCLVLLSWGFILILVLYGKFLPPLLVPMSVELGILMSALKTIIVFLHVFLIYLGKGPKIWTSTPETILEHKWLGEKASLFSWWDMLLERKGTSLLTSLIYILLKRIFSKVWFSWLPSPHSRQQKLIYST